MSKIIIGSEEWKEARRKLVTASDMPVIMGVSPWLTPLELYRLKKSGRELKQTAAMERGNALEEKARKMFEVATGEIVFPEFIISEEHPWLAATFDGINDNCFVEIKWGNLEDHENALQGIIPEKYIPQLAAQQIVSKGKIGHFFHCFEGHKQPYAMVTIECVIQESFLNKGKAFYDCLQNNIEPERTKRDPFPLPKETISKERELYHLIQIAADAGNKIEVLRKELIESCEGSYREGSYLKFKPVETKGVVNYSLIPEIKDIDLEKYRKKSYTKWMVTEL